MLLPNVKGTACLAAKVQSQKAWGSQGGKRGGTFTVENAIDPLLSQQ